MEKLETTCPAWDRFIDYLTGVLGKEEVRFLQEFAGYSTTADTSHEIALWIWGPPDEPSGISTFVEGVSSALADRALHLGLDRLKQSRFALGSIPIDSTLLILTECMGGELRSPALTCVLDELICGERVYVERKYEEPYDAVVPVKLLFPMNFRPGSINSGVRLWQHVKGVQLPPLPERAIDPWLKSQIKTEGPGILQWALDGLARLNARGRFAPVHRSANGEWRELDEVN